MKTKTGMSGITSQDEKMDKRGASRNCMVLEVFQWKLKMEE